MPRSVTHTFAVGDVIDSEEMDTNFSDVAGWADEHDSEIADLQTDVAALQTASGTAIKKASGTGSISTDGSGNATLTVTHSLNATPFAAGLIPNAADWTWGVSARSATQLTFTIHTNTPSSSLSTPWWVLA